MAHHLLELLEIHIPVAVGVNGLDHPVAILHGALHLKPIEDQVELGGGDEAVFVLVVEIKCVFELGASAITGVSHPEGVELVAVNVEVDHHARKLLCRDVGAEGPEDVAELGDGYIAIAVGVKAFQFNSTTCNQDHKSPIHNHKNPITAGKAQLGFPYRRT